jgi:hypothetical protein
VILPSSPKSKKELFTRLKSVLGNEYEILPQCKGGSGAPGMMLELLLGSEGRSKNIADSVGTEIKFKTEAPTLLTLFHKEIDGGSKALANFVLGYGKVDEEGRVSFRNTVRNSEIFRVVRQEGRVIVRAKNDRSKEVFWSENVLVNAASKKLNDLVLVSGSVESRNGVRFVKFNSATRLTNLKITDFLNAITGGYVVVDFDARQKEPGSKTLRNHGTKFRMKTEDIGEVWGTIQKDSEIDRWPTR